LPRLSPLLRQPPILSVVCFAVRCTALPRVTEGIGRSWRIRAADQRIKSHVCQQSFRQGKANARPGLVTAVHLRAAPGNANKHAGKALRFVALLIKRGLSLSGVMSLPGISLADTRQSAPNLHVFAMFRATS